MDLRSFKDALLLPGVTLPLVRLPNGDLGVRAVGGGGTVNHYTVNISVDARGATRDAVDGFRRSGRQVAGQVQRGLRG